MWCLIQCGNFYFSLPLFSLNLNNFSAQICCKYLRNSACGEAFFSFPDKVFFKKRKEKQLLLYKDDGFFFLLILALLVRTKFIFDL